MSLRHVLAECRELKTVESPEYPGGMIEGYASVFGNVDEGGDIVVPGAFTKTIAEGIPRKRVKLLDSHRMGGTQGAIGLVLEAKEDDYGLLFKGFFSQTAVAQEIRTKVKEGVLDALSFGYDVIKHERDNTTGVRLLKELRLWEVSVVNWGMNPLAHITAAKSLDLMAPNSVLRESVPDRPWNAEQALQRVKTWAGKGKPESEWQELDWCRYASAFVDRKGIREAMDLKYLIADVFENDLLIVPAACQEAHNQLKAQNSPEAVASLTLLKSFCQQREIALVEDNSAQEKALQDFMTSVALHAFVQKVKGYAG